MQSKAIIYARALSESLESAKTDKEAVRRIQRFRELLKKRGDLKLGGKILREFQKAWASREGAIALVRAAKPLSASARANVRAELKRRGFQMDERVMPELLGGMAVFLPNGMLVDGTVRTKLQRIWSQLR